MQVLSWVCAVDLGGRVFCWVSIFKIGLGVGEWLNWLGAQSGQTRPHHHNGEWVSQNVEGGGKSLYSEEGKTGKT